MNGWEQTPSGLYVPVEVETVPVPQPPPVYIPPRKEFRPPPLNGFPQLSWREFDQYIKSVDGAPCPSCGEPIQQGERHESMCRFSCTAVCGWRARTNADGQVTISFPKKG